MVIIERCKVEIGGLKEVGGAVKMAIMTEKNNLIKEFHERKNSKK